MDRKESRKRPRARRSFTAEFKAEIVELCRRGDRSVGAVARDFDLTETAVREWVRQAELDDGTRSDGFVNAERLLTLFCRSNVSDHPAVDLFWDVLVEAAVRSCAG